APAPPPPAAPATPVVPDGYRPAVPGPVAPVQPPPAGPPAEPPAAAPAGAAPWTPVHAPPAQPVPAPPFAAPPVPAPPYAAPPGPAPPYAAPPVPGPAYPPPAYGSPPYPAAVYPPPAQPGPPAYGGAPPTLPPAGPPPMGAPWGWNPVPYAPRMAWPVAPPPQRVVQTLTRRNWIWVVGATAVIAAVLGGVIGVLSGLGSQQTIVEKFFPNQSVLGKPVDIQEVLSRVEPAVVSIDTTVFSASSGAGNGEVVEGAGTGMIITPQGEVLTNNHVVAGATTLTVTLFGQTKARTAHVIGTDPSKDLALVQIDNAHNLPTVTLGNSAAAQVGDEVIAIGNALALQGGPTVTNGIVSAKDRSLSAEADFSNTTENLTGLLQTDAPINPGNSGGPLVNAQAQVIGMNTAVATSSQGNAPAQNVGFAIAVNAIKPELTGLLKGGTGGTNGGVPARSTNSHTAYMGVVVENVTPAVAKAQGLTPTSGALISGLTSGGPADQAGLKVNDVIVAVNGAAVTNVTQLVHDIQSHPVGATVTIGYYRGPVRSTVLVKLGSEP
ncbi:MAG: S1C family serine protease, partial [Acidimicrobiales bacterium]